MSSLKGKLGGPPQTLLYLEHKDFVEIRREWKNQVPLCASPSWQSSSALTAIHERTDLIENPGFEEFKNRNTHDFPYKQEKNWILICRITQFAEKYQKSIQEVCDSFLSSCLADVIGISDRHEDAGFDGTDLTQCREILQKHFSQTIPEKFYCWNQKSAHAKLVKRHTELVRRRAEGRLRHLTSTTNHKKSVSHTGYVRRKNLLMGLVLEIAIGIFVIGIAAYFILNFL